MQSTERVGISLARLPPEPNAWIDTLAHRFSEIAKRTVKSPCAFAETCLERRTSLDKTTATRSPGWKLEPFTTTGARLCNRTAG